MRSPAPDTGEIWSVSDIVTHIKALLAREVPPLWVEGEISNYTHASSGHRYFTLKDERNQLKSAFFKGRARGLKFEPADGLKVIALGQVDVYGPRSDLQLIVERLIPSGRGELELAFQQLHDRLQKEGLFDAARKRPLPPFPRRIGLITSARGAAIRDLLKVLRRRAPQVELVIADTPVQGTGAAPAIVHAVECFNRAARVDLLIMGRGGGSLEDLWPFNEEIVVRAVVASQIPIIAGVGHEVDTTLCELAADLRAATPSVAGEIAIRSRTDWLADLGEWSRRITQGVELHLVDARASLRSLVERYGFRRPQEALDTFAQRLDELQLRLRNSGRRLLEEHHSRLGQLDRRPGLKQPELLVRARRQALAAAAASLRSAWPRVTVRKRERLARVTGSLEALSPRGVLARGFAVLTDEEGRVVSSIAQVETGQTTRTILADGRIESRVEHKEKGTSWR